MLNESQKNTLNSILLYYQERYSITKGSSNTSLRFGSTSTTATSFCKMLQRDEVALKAHCGRANYNTILDLLSERFNTEDEKEIVKELSNILFGKLKEIAHKKSIDNAIGKNTSSNKEIVKTFSYENIVPIIDITTTQKAMFNVSSGNVAHGVSYETYLEWLGKQPKEVKDALNTLFSPAKIDFDPQTGGEYTYVKVSDGQEIISVNSHCVPEWRKKEIASPVLPKMFVDLMKHLFPNPDCQEYVYAWIYHMLDSRCPVHLLMHGHRGVGKNTLVYILENLVGTSNYYYVPKEFFDNNFNSELRHKRLLYFDEHKIDTKVNEAAFKQYHEPRMSYHGKGTPIMGNEKNHASHIISNNTEVTNHIVYESRRYSVPILGTKPIKEALGEDWVTEIHRLKTDKDFLANLGWWILKNANISKYPSETPYKSKAFYDIVDKALFPWQSFILKLIKERQASRIFLKDFEDEEDMKFNRKVIGRVHIENFLDSHKDPEGASYGRLIQTKEGRVIEVNPKYHPQVEQETPIPEEEEASNEFEKMVF